MPGPVVFLHIPKTAGQTVHHGLTGLVGGAAHVSPVRVHDQAAPDAQMPPGYRLYSGHIDWVDLETLPPDRFAFTVLRDPRERIASFYFYLQAEARRLPPAERARPERQGMARLLSETADDYFMGGDAGWQRFIRDHYDNFYTRYMLCRRFRGGMDLGDLPPDVALRRAQRALAGLNGVYTVEGLAQLEADLARHSGTRPVLAGQVHNAGPMAPGRPRWPALMACLGTAAQSRLESFVRLDEPLFSWVQQGQAQSRPADAGHGPALRIVPDP